MLLRDEQSDVTQPVNQRVKVIVRKFSWTVSRAPRWITHSRIRAKTRIALERQKHEAKPTRIKALAEWFSSFRSLLVNFVILAALIPFLYLLVTQVISTSIIVRPIPVPEALSKRGYAPEVFAMRVATEMARINREAETMMPRKDIAWNEAEPDIQIPGQSISFRAVVQYIKEFLGFKDIAVSIDVTEDKSDYIAQIRIIGGPYDGKQGKTISPLSHNNDEFVLKVAEEAMHVTQPYVWASYVTSVEEARWGGSKSFDSGKCIALYDEILNTSLSDYDRKWALLGKGYVLSKLGRNEERIECYHNAIKIDPKFAPAYDNWGIVLQALHKYEEAIRKYEKATKLNPKFADAYYNWGMALQALKKYDEATRKYEKVTKLNPKFAGAYYNWGEALQALKKYDEATRKYEKAIELNPKDADSYLSWGIALRHLGKHDEAIRKYKKSNEIRDEKAIRN